MTSVVSTRGMFDAAIARSPMFRLVARQLLLVGFVCIIVSDGPGTAVLSEPFPPERSVEISSLDAEAERSPGAGPRPRGVVGAGARQALQIAADASLNDEQQGIAQFLANRYRRGIDQIQHFVAHAYQSGAAVKIDPWLILAVMAVESGFDPFAQSKAGAQGLMQVVTRVNIDRFAPFGGAKAAFDPIANIRVGAEILQLLVSKTGSIEGALKYYVGAANRATDGGFGKRVLAVREMIAQAATSRAPAVLAGPSSTLPLRRAEPMESDELIAVRTSSSGPVIGKVLVETSTVAEGPVREAPPVSGPDGASL